MRKSLAVAIAILCAPVLVAKSFTPKENTHAAIKAYVEAAARHVSKYGPDCAAFSTPEWRSGDYYIFVDAPDNTTLCHPNASIDRESPECDSAINSPAPGMIFSSPTA